MTSFQQQSDSSEPVSNKLSASNLHLIGLFLVFIVGFGLQALLNYSVSKTIEQLDQYTQNTRYQGYLSENILHAVQAIEADFYRLTITENSQTRQVSLSQIKQAEKDIINYVEVLQRGGIFSLRQLSLDSNKSMMEPYVYQLSEGGGDFKVEVEILQLVNQLVSRIELFESVLVQRDQMMLTFSPELTRVMLEIRVNVRELMPDFERLTQYADQLRQGYVERLQAVEQQVSAEKNKYRNLQLGLTLLVLALGILMIDFVARQLRRTHRNLEASEAYVSDVLESQTHIIVVTAGVKIIDASGGFFAFFKQYPDLSAFLQQHQCICDVFIKEPGLVYKFEDKNWVEYILEHPDQTHRAKIQRDRKVFTFQLTATRSTRFKRFIVSLADITEIEALNQRLEQEKDRALASTKSKSEFLANMSHEIRTPLNAILGFIELLKEKEINPERLRYLRTVYYSGQTLLGIINDILDFSKIENNKLDLDIHAFDPRQELSSVAHLFAARCEEKKLCFKLDMADDLPGKIESDPLRIKQVLSNLLSNAVKFTPSGKTVDLKIDYDSECQQLVCEVRDQGIGIAKENQTKIFEAFSQAESSTTRQYGGTGLGLSISTRLIEMLGGELNLESQLGLGSCFTFKIPAKLIQAKPSQPALLDKKVELASLSGKVLLVEDNPTNQMLMKVVLKKIGVEFDVANDGVEGVAMYQANAYDAIIMDENMPNMSGIAATKRIRQLEAASQKEAIPIIALTANAIKGDRERFMAVGMDDYLTKPVDFKLLGQILSKYLPQQSSS
ncbi:response regulator [Thiomicrospira microaerophila]|uniref:ATP-binding protein n=1 Tax=Thiomicrospira microaerophila TaxID=406020 RepID=UPI00200FE0B4|nr:ATP-binding protein [Thiomicrospira microaerophila]UQB41873.1 response regulator [Thiomicrospira microaerophila]